MIKLLFFLKNIHFDVIIPVHDTSSNLLERRRRRRRLITTTTTMTMMRTTTTNATTTPIITAWLITVELSPVVRLTHHIGITCWVVSSEISGIFGAKFPDIYCNLPSYRKCLTPISLSNNSAISSTFTRILKA